jgi:hypothetical protein
VFPLSVPNSVPLPSITMKPYLGGQDGGGGGGRTRGIAVITQTARGLHTGAFTFNSMEQTKGTHGGCVVTKLCTRGHSVTSFDSAAVKTAACVFFPHPPPPHTHTHSTCPPSPLPAFTTCARVPLPVSPPKTCCYINPPPPHTHTPTHTHSLVV